MRGKFSKRTGEPFVPRKIQGEIKMKKTGFGIGLFLCLAMFAGNILGQTPGIQLQPYLSRFEFAAFYDECERRFEAHFVVQQGGIIKGLFSRVRRPRLDFINLTSKVSFAGGELYSCKRFCDFRLWFCRRQQGFLFSKR